MCGGSVGGMWPAVCICIDMDTMDRLQQWEYKIQHEITFTAAHEAVCVFVVSPEHGCAGKSSQCDIGTDDSGF